MLALLALLASTPALAADDVLAVLPFEVHTDEATWAQMGDGAADMLVTDLSRGEGVRLVERARIQAVLDELALQQSAFVDPETAKRVGEGLGATAVVVGSVTVKGEVLRLDARLVDVATGETLLADQAEGPAKDFFTLERTLALRLLRQLDVELDRETVAYLKGGDAGVRTHRSPPPEGGPRATVSLHKRIHKSFVFVDGVLVGEHTRKDPVEDLDVSVGKHELALAADEGGTVLRVLGVVDVPEGGLVLKSIRKARQIRDRQAKPPWTSVRRGGVIWVDGDEAGWAEVTLGPVEEAWNVEALSVDPGRHSLLFSSSSGPGAEWACSGMVDVLPETDPRWREVTIRIDGAGCHGFDEPGVTPTIGPSTFSAQKRAAAAAEREAERKAREAELEAQRAGR